MAYEKSGTHFVIARNEQEAARNVLTYPHDANEMYDPATAAARLDGVRSQFGEDYDLFIVQTMVVVGARASDILKEMDCPENTDETEE